MYLSDGKKKPNILLKTLGFLQELKNVWKLLE